MELHLEELVLARRFSEAALFQPLTKEQLTTILEHGRRLHRWFKRHRAIHRCINLTVVLLLLGGDFYVLLHLPGLLLDASSAGTVGRLLVAILVGAVHSWIIYSVVVFSLHEGAAHDLIFPPTGRVNAILAVLANNLCRLGSADPIWYARNHKSHHAHFGTESDGEFLNFVLRRRYWLTFLPFAIFINYSDFVVHRKSRHTGSELVSIGVALTYNIVYGRAMMALYGLPFTILVLAIVFPHVGFYIDRARQFTEHNLMPLENKDGSRSFGLGFWGMLIGGGPWGQPCHWSHHLVPSIPWYQQLILHRRIVRLLTAVQREQYLIEPFIGFPQLFARLWSEPTRFARIFGRDELRRQTDRSTECDSRR
jgi:hypothetical protein